MVINRFPSPFPFINFRYSLDFPLQPLSLLLSLPFISTIFSSNCLLYNNQFRKVFLPCSNYFRFSLYKFLPYSIFYMNISSFFANSSSIQTLIALLSAQHICNPIHFSNWGTPEQRQSKTAFIDSLCRFLMY